ncbi:AAA family ATPase [Limimaricola cinnabarinus]|uniref:Endonuclease GajA/Old nuclease/RecF-like AAA domain-containing protein n=1 Tax=Limimaricola cinnabarinus TaxID=1125964 RepID=A0A2G1MI05_9RHOB|nr:hypothetical protein CJ301_06535 [Limimaricola cinnabarinus]
MKISAIKVKGYRTVKDELELPCQSSLTLVGPNNSGKTNTLRAIRSFFTGYENELGYNYERDLCKGSRPNRRPTFNSAFLI